MIFEIRHRITYRYDQPVLLEPLTIRLQPRSDGAQRLLNWNSSFDPTPNSSTEILDIFDNPSVQVAFGDVATGLTLLTEARVETFRSNPFNFLLDPQLDNLPAAYGVCEQQALTAYLRRTESGEGVDRWASTIAAAVDHRTQRFLLSLTELVNREFSSAPRITGPPHAPAQTLETHAGACRDLSLLFMDACRSQGLASRFVSGYVHDPLSSQPPDLHAWAEVYLTGGGWRGYDPSLGIAVADSHVAVAAGPSAVWAAPTAGCYRGGTNVKSTIDYEIVLQRVSR